MSEHDKEFAIIEGECIAASETYFGAMARAGDISDKQRCFDAGFHRGYRAGAERTPAARSRVPEMWWPMDRAPKEERYVILRNSNMHQVLAHWMDGGTFSEDHPPIEAGWYFFNGRLNDLFRDPVQWRYAAAPEAPQGEAEPVALLRTALGLLRHSGITSATDKKAIVDIESFLAAQPAPEPEATCNHSRKSAPMSPDNTIAGPWECLDCGKVIELQLFPTTDELWAMFEALEHAANEWADIATNGYQWLKNVRDGISTFDEALADMERGFEYCRGVSACARAIKERGQAK